MDISTATQSLAALAQDTRLEIFRFLVQRGPAGVPVGTIAEQFDLPGATLSFHLNALKQAGLLAVRRAGRMLFYSPDFERMGELLAFLMDDCCGGQCSITAVSKPRR